MKTPIETLIEKITPLPWNLHGVHIYKEGNSKTGANVASAGSPRTGGTTVGYEPLGCTDPDLHEAYRNASYLVHCANNFPKLLEALEMIKQRFEDNEKDFEEDVKYIQVCEALTQAREVKG